MKKENFAMIAETFFDNAEIVEFCNKEIAKLDRKAEAKQTASEENAKLMDEMHTWIANEGPRVAASEVANGVGISSQKASYLLRLMVNEGRLTRENEGRRYVYTA